MKLIVNKLNADYLGMTASISCAIHCALLPLIITSLPLIGLEFLANIWFEIAMIGLSLVIAIYSLSKAYAKHQSYLPFILLVIGFTSITLGHLVWHEVEYLLIPLGGFTIALAHFVNWKKSKRCQCQPNIKL